jgi:hypothetical protein
VAITLLVLHKPLLALSPAILLPLFFSFCPSFPPGFEYVPSPLSNHLISVLAVALQCKPET